MTMSFHFSLCFAWQSGYKHVSATVSPQRSCTETTYSPVLLAYNILKSKQKKTSGRLYRRQCPQRKKTSVFLSRFILPQWMPFSGQNSHFSHNPTQNFFPLRNSRQDGFSANDPLHFISLSSHAENVYR